MWWTYSASPTPGRSRVNRFSKNWGDNSPPPLPSLLRHFCVENVNLGGNGTKTSAHYWYILISVMGRSLSYKCQITTTGRDKNYEAGGCPQPKNALYLQRSSALCNYLERPVLKLLLAFKMTWFHTEKYEKKKRQIQNTDGFLVCMSIVYIFHYLCWNNRYLAIRGIWYTYIILLNVGEWRGNTDKFNLVSIAQNI